MLHEVLDDFVKVDSVSDDFIRKFEGQLPSAFLALWKDYGFGTFYHGYLKVINPDEYAQIMMNSYFQGDVSIPILATAFGDIITWEKNRFVGIVKYRYGDNDVISDGFEFFFDIIADEECAAEYFTMKKYKAAIKKYGNLEYDECFGYVPLLGLGGKESVNNLNKVKIREHIALITEMVGAV